MRIGRKVEKRPREICDGSVTTLVGICDLTGEFSGDKMEKSLRNLQSKRRK
jgi:hypothetical protein